MPEQNYDVKTQCKKGLDAALPALSALEILQRELVEDYIAKNAELMEAAKIYMWEPQLRETIMSAQNKGADLLEKIIPGVLVEAFAQYPRIVVTVAVLAQMESTRRLIEVLVKGCVTELDRGNDTSLSNL